MLPTTVLVLTLAVLAVPAELRAGPPAMAEVDTVDVYETRHNHLLALPKYLWSALIYPIGQLTIWAERRGHFAGQGGEKATRWLPFVVFGGETGTGEETGPGGGITLLRTDLFGRGRFSTSLVGNLSNYSGTARYKDPGIGGGPWYWNASIEALDTDDDHATINSEGEPGGREQRFRYRRQDARLAIGHHSNHGETEGFEPDAVVELRLAYGFRRYDDTGRRSSAMAGANEAIDLFSAGLRVAFDDRDYKPPTTSISPPMNYQLSGRVLLFANDRYYRFRDRAFPEHGGLIQVEADYTAGSREVRYYHYAAEIQRFFTLFYRNRILALRARLEKAHPLGDDSLVPYSELTTLGGGQRLRGYRRGFFRGEGSLLFSAEYRYPIWDTWNAFLFWDEGQVFDGYDALEMDRFEYSYGAGISVRTERAFLCGVRIARSEEEAALVGFSLRQEF